MRCPYCGNYDPSFRESEIEINGDELTRITKIVCHDCDKTSKLKEVYKLDWYDYILEE